MRQFFKKYSWFTKIFGAIVGLATIVGTIYAILTFYSPSKPVAESNAQIYRDKTITGTENNEVRNSKIETHNQTSKIEINAKNSNVNTGIVEGNLNQSITVDEFPEPKIYIETESLNTLKNELYVTKIIFNVESKTVINNIYIKAVAPSITSIDLDNTQPKGNGGLFLGGRSGSRDGYAFINIQNAVGKYRFVILSKKPEKFNIEYKIN